MPVRWCEFKWSSLRRSPLLLSWSPSLSEFFKSFDTNGWTASGESEICWRGAEYDPGPLEPYSKPLRRHCLSSSAFQYLLRLRVKATQSSVSAVTSQLLKQRKTPVFVAVVCSCWTLVFKNTWKKYLKCILKYLHKMYLKQYFKILACESI